MQQKIYSENAIFFCRHNDFTFQRFHVPTPSAQHLLAPSPENQATVAFPKGKEYEFVFLDTLIFGGMDYPLGFMTDLNRMCVTLSRAKIGFLIRTMGNVPYYSAGTIAWK